MVFTIVKNTEFTFRKYKNMKMAIWHITTHFVVEGHISLHTHKKEEGVLSIFVFLLVLIISPLFKRKIRRR